MHSSLPGEREALNSSFTTAYATIAKTNAPHHTRSKMVGYYMRISAAQCLGMKLHLRQSLTARI
jgi:hypothetical protein